MATILESTDDVTNLIWEQRLPYVGRSCLTIVWVGDNPASNVYVMGKRRKGEELGVDVEVIHYPAGTDFTVLARKVSELSASAGVHGIIVQLPVVGCTKEQEAQLIDMIAHEKDVDNLRGSGRFLSPVIQAIAALEEYYTLDFTSRRVAVVGYGRLVGRPVVQWLSERGIKYVLVDVDTPNADELIQSSDVIIAGSNVQGRINASNVRPGQIVIDGWRDVVYDEVSPIVAAITPAKKGGIGRGTVVGLLRNTNDAAFYQQQ